MAKFWNSTAIADFIRGTAYPKYATWEEWESIKKLAKAQHPIRYWLVEDFTDGVRAVLKSPFTLAKNIQIYIRNRFVDKMHCLTANRKEIVRGKYHSFDHRLVHCIFGEYVTFVNEELASEHEDYYKEQTWKYRIPYLSSFFSYSNPKLGLARLVDLATEKYENNELPDSHIFVGVPSERSLVWKQLLEVYVWYTSVYPELEDPDVISGYSEHIDLFGFGWGSGISPAEAAKKRALYKESQRISAEREDLITKYLTTLIRYRAVLWT